MKALEPMSESFAAIRRLAERSIALSPEEREARERQLVRASGRKWCDTCRGNGCDKCRPTVEDRLRDCGVPPILAGARFATVAPELRETAAAVAGIVSGDFRESLLFIGPTGRGKTHLAACVCRWALGAGWSVAWAHVPALLRELKASYSRDRAGDGDVESERQQIERLRSARLLVLNDLGAEEVISPWVRSQIETLIDDRIEQERRTVITSNLDPEQLGAAYGERFASRLGQRFFRHVPFDGTRLPDFRARRTA